MGVNLARRYAGIVAVGVVALAGCSDNAVTAPAAPEGPRAWRLPPEENPPPPSSAPPEWDIGPLANPKSYRILPTELVDLMEQSAQSVLMDPRYAHQHAKAQEILAMLPAVREKLAAGYYGNPEGAAPQSLSSRRAAEGDFEVAPAMTSIGWSPYTNERPSSEALYEMFTTGGGDAAIDAVYSIGFGNIATVGFSYGMDGFVMGGVDCKEQVWNWTVAVGGLAGGVLAVAAGVSALATIPASGGFTTVPALTAAHATIGAGAYATYVGIGNLYFANANMWDCVYRASYEGARITPRH